MAFPAKCSNLLHIGGQSKHASINEDRYISDKHQPQAITKGRLIFLTYLIKYLRFDPYYQEIYVTFIWKGEFALLDVFVILDT